MCTYVHMYGVFKNATIAAFSNHTGTEHGIVCVAGAAAGELGGLRDPRNPCTCYPEHESEHKEKSSFCGAASPLHTDRMRWEAAGTLAPPANMLHNFTSTPDIDLG